MEVVFNKNDDTFPKTGRKGKACVSRMNGRRYGQPLRPDINIFNFHSLLAALTCLAVLPTCRGRKNYKPCVFSYMACSFTCHRDSFSPKRAYGHEKRRSDRLSCFSDTNIIHFRAKSK